MCLLTVIFIIVFSVVLFASAVAIIIKLFGTGFLYGHDITLCLVMTENDNAEEKLSDIVEALDAECRASMVKIVIIDGGMNVGQLEVCRKYTEKYSYFLLISPDRTNEILFSLKKEKAL